MSDYFKDLLNQSYSDRMTDDKINPFSDPFAIDDLFPLSSDNNFSEFKQDESIQCVLVILNDSQLTERYISVDSRIDFNSKIILKTFNEMLIKMYRPKISQDVSLLAFEKRISAPQWDFSSLICYLSKVLEIELNNSVIQWIRRKKGIEMPQYYNRVKPGFECRVSDKIDLNAPFKGNEKLCCKQTIGSIKVLMDLYCKKMPEPLSKVTSELSRMLNEIRDTRNSSSHTSVMDEKQFFKFYDDFRMIMEKGWFTVLMDLKMKMKGSVD